MMKPRLLRVSLLLACAACAPRTTVARVRDVPAATVVTSAGTVDDRLFLGRSIRDGRMVTDAEWAAFLSGFVTPRFPDGLTVYRAEGRWRDSASGGVGREQTFVLEIVHPAGADADTAIASIAAEYRRRFHQSSVLRVTAPVRMQVY